MLNKIREYLTDKQIEWNSLITNRLEYLVNDKKIPINFKGNPDNKRFQSRRFILQYSDMRITRSYLLCSLLSNNRFKIYKFLIVKYNDNFYVFLNTEDIIDYRPNYTLINNIFDVEAEGKKPRK